MKTATVKGTYAHRAFARLIDDKILGLNSETEERIDTCNAMLAAGRSFRAIKKALAKLPALNFGTSTR